MFLSLVVSLIALTSLVGCDEDGPWTDSCERVDSIEEELFTRLDFGEGRALFRDATLASGTGHMHDLRDQTYHYESSVGGGVAMEDFDSDGDLDLIVTGGREPNAYYINQGAGIFLECASGAGLAWSQDWSMGVSVADYDNDGDRDVLLLNHGPNRLLENRGDGSFLDVSKDSGLNDSERSSGASWADLDGDGHLDLLVANLQNTVVLGGHTVYPSGSSKLYRNLGDGKFEDLSDEVGTEGFRQGSSYIAPMIDFDGDGLPDLLITQEFGKVGERNRIYQNLGRTEEGRWLGWRDRNEGSNIEYPYSVMGAALMDLNKDMLPELFLTNLISEPPEREVFLMNLGDFQFEDATDEYGLNGMVADVEQEFYRSASWAAVALDYDNDGDDDLYTAYGNLNEDDYMPFSCRSLHGLCPNQPNLLQRNDGDSSFASLAGTFSEDHGQSRGVAAGDVDGDGCLDLYVVNVSSPSRLLLGLCEDAGRSIELRLEGTVSNRDAVGAIVVIEIGEKLQTKYVTAGATSVHSAQPFMVHIGVGEALMVDRLTVIWPTGLQESFESIEVSTSTTNTYSVREGDGSILLLSQESAP